MRPAPEPRLNPDRSQFSKYDPVSLNCSSGDSGPWAVLRNTSRDTRIHCGDDWGKLEGSVCTVKALFTGDSGLYWCERDKHSSEPVRITVSEHKGTFPTGPPPAPSTFSTAPTPPPFTPPTSSSDLLVPLVCSGLFLLPLLILLLLLLRCKCRRRKPTQGDDTDGQLHVRSSGPANPNGIPRAKDDARPEEGVAEDVTYSDILHPPPAQQERPVGRAESEQSPVYSCVKTQDVCSPSNQTRGSWKGLRDKRSSPLLARASPANINVTNGCHKM